MVSATCRRAFESITKLSLGLARKSPIRDKERHDVIVLKAERGSLLKGGVKGVTLELIPRQDSHGGISTD